MSNKMYWWGKFKGGVLVALGSFIISNMVVYVTNNPEDIPYFDAVFDSVVGLVCLFWGIHLIFKKP